jgi:intein-encoded DNA endonuclease-like protein
LAEYNIVPNKSKIFTMPLDKIPDKYIWDFVRGLMDGDGCITLLTH